MEKKAAVSGHLNQAEDNTAGAAENKAVQPAERSGKLPKDQKQDDKHEACGPNFSLVAQLPV